MQYALSDEFILSQLEVSPPDSRLCPHLRLMLFVIFHTNFPARGGVSFAANGADDLPMVARASLSYGFRRQGANALSIYRGNESPTPIMTWYRLTLGCKWNASFPATFVTKSFTQIRAASCASDNGQLDLIRRKVVAEREIADGGTFTCGSNVLNRYGDG
ncbi:hypothetical protein BD410DRAFT_190570 [Rickenella mellea]|uniref:Uncharacterized protein n=1 Tax=Rickenella mellea TaxID=50990 RepID=A0A4Y7PGT0_9AGAM|nr:hypothetical protein BD410DRAFT_190570 [Rickenella mellea]